MTVTASAEGYADGSATSDGKSVAKLATASSGSLDRTLLFGTRSVGYDVKVTASAGVVPSGTATVYVDNRAVQTVELGADGRAEVTLTGLRRGIHLVTVRYEGTAQLAASRSLPDLLIVI